MKALLQLQWSLHKSTLFLLIVIMSIITYFFYDAGTEMSRATFALVFAIYSADMSKRIFTDQQTQYILYSMPLPRQTLIKNLYITSFIICTIVYLLILPLQLYSGFLQDDLYTYITTFVGLYGASLLGISFDLSFQLNNLEQSSRQSFLSFIAGMFVIFIPHLMLSYITHEPTFWLRLFMMPIISVMLYMYLTHRNVKKFADRELL